MTILKCFIILLSCFAFISGCKNEPLSPLRIGTNRWPGYESLYLANSLGMFDEHAIKLVEMPSATEVARSLRNESLDVAALTLDETLTLLQYVPDLRVILIMDSSNGADVLLAKPSIQALEDLKGKRVGVENTAVGALLLDAALQAAKLEVGDITLVPVSVNAHEDYYTGDKVDALVTFEPHKTRLLDKGAKSLYDSSRIPERIMDVMVTRRAVLEHRKDALDRVIAAHFQALSYLSGHSEAATAFIAQHLGVTPVEVTSQFNSISIPGLAENQRLIGGDSPGLKSAVSNLAALMQQRRLLFKAIDTEHLLNGSSLPNHHLK